MTSLANKICEILVVKGQERTLAQLAQQLRSTKSSISSRVSELRGNGCDIISEKRVDTKGRVKYFYRHNARSKYTHFTKSSAA
jgi:predicted transcriptional regulator